MGVFQTTMFGGLWEDQLRIFVRRWVVICHGMTKRKRSYEYVVTATDVEVKFGGGIYISNEIVKMVLKSEFYRVRTI